MKTMKRTILVGASMFALCFSASAQVDDAQALAAYQAEWMVLHNVTQMTSNDYTQMKTDWVESLSAAFERPTVEMAAVQEMEAKKAARNIARGLPADFPYKINTGNPQADEAAFQLEKELWIDNNQALYNQMITNSTPTAAQLEERNQVLNNN